MAGSRGPSFEFRCPECYVGLRAPVDKAGARKTCPSCQAKIIVPAPPKAGKAAPEPEEKDLYAVRNEAAALPEVGYVAVVCPVCRTRMVATQDQIGQTMACPDCDSKVPVVRPEKAPQRQPAFQPVEFDGATEYAIQEDRDSPPEASDPAQPAEIPLVCPLCSTLMYASEDQIGEKVVCRDCETSVVVRPRPKAKPKPKPEPVEEYGVGKPIEPAYPNVVRFFEDRSQPSEEDEQSDTWEFTLPSRPEGPLFAWMFNFLRHEGAWPRCIGLSLGVVFLIGLFVPGMLMILRTSDSLLMFPGVVTVSLAAVLTLPWCVIAAGIFLAIVEDTADGAEYVASWPEAAEIWSGAIFFFITGMGASMTPGVIVAQLVPGAGHLNLLLVPAGVFLIFPFLLLSMLEQSSPVNPWSEPIFRSVFVTWWAWLLFYVQAAVLTSVWGGFIWLCVAYLGLWSLVLLGPVAVLTLLIYFRLLGRLGWNVSGRRTVRQADDFYPPARQEESPDVVAAEQAKPPQPPPPSKPPKQSQQPQRLQQSQQPGLREH